MVKAYGNGEENPAYEKKSICGIFTKREFVTSASAGNKKSIITNGETDGDLLTPMWITTGETDNSVPEKQIFWVDEESPVTFEGLVENTEVFLTKDASTVTAQASGIASIMMNAADQASEKSNVVIQPANGTAAFVTKIEYDGEEGQTGTVQIDGTADKTVEVNGDSETVELNGAREMTVTVEKDGQTYQQSYEDVDQYDKVDVEVIENPDSGEKELAVKGDKDGDGIAEEDVPIAKPKPVEHTWGEWTVTKQPTVFAKGSKTRTCLECGESQTKSIAKLKATISVNVTTIPLRVKQSTTAVKVTCARGDKIVSWKSSNKKVATVTSKGKITARKKGKATITVKLKSGKTAKIKVTVQKKKVKTKKLQLNRKKVTLAKGKTCQLKITVTPVTSGYKVTYKSSNRKIAIVSSKGKITAKKKGTVYIIVTSGSKKVKCKVTVK